MLKEGDSYARSKIPWLDMFESCRIIRDALQKMPKSGSVRVKLKPKPKGGDTEVYRRVESGRGALAMHIVSDGNSQPYRIKINAVSYTHLTLPTTPYV